MDIGSEYMGVGSYEPLVLHVRTLPPPMTPSRSHVCRLLRHSVVIRLNAKPPVSDLYAGGRQRFSLSLHPPLPFQVPVSQPVPTAQPFLGITTVVRLSLILTLKLIQTSRLATVQTLYIMSVELSVSAPCKPSSPLALDLDGHSSPANASLSSEAIKVEVKVDTVTVTETTHSGDAPPSPPIIDRLSLDSPEPRPLPIISSTPRNPGKTNDLYHLMTPPDSGAKNRGHSRVQSADNSLEVKVEDVRQRSQSSVVDIANKKLVPAVPIAALVLSPSDSSGEEDGATAAAPVEIGQAEILPAFRAGTKRAPIFLPRQSFSSPDPFYNPNNTTNVYINGLPPFFTHEQLIRLAAEFGKVLSCRVFHRFNQMKPSGAGQQEGSTYAFVLYETVEDATRCITSLRKYSDLHPSFARTQRLPGPRAPQPTTAEGLLDRGRPEYRGSPEGVDDVVLVPAPRSATQEDVNVLIQGLPASATARDVQTLVLPNEPISVRLIPIGTEAKRDGRQIAYVKFSSRTAADETIKKLHMTPVNGWTETSVDGAVVLEVVIIRPVEQQATRLPPVKTPPASATSWGSSADPGWGPVAQSPSFSPHTSPFRPTFSTHQHYVDYATQQQARQLQHLQLQPTATPFLPQERSRRPGTFYSHLQESASLYSMPAPAAVQVGGNVMSVPHADSSSSEGDHKGRKGRGPSGPWRRASAGARKRD